MEVNYDQHEEWIDYVKMFGESIIKNAESIVGTEDFLKCLTISIYFNHGEAPYIDVNRSFDPEGLHN